jgi:hypothetical protein
MHYVVPCATELRDRSCGNIMFNNAVLNPLLFQRQREGQPWITAHLRHTTTCNPNFWYQLRKHICNRQPQQLALSSAPPNWFCNRPRPEVWACDGHGRPVKETTTNNWAVVVVLSTPVNQRHFALHSNGSKLCRTFRNVFHRLQDCQKKDKILVVDIFPFVGHASALGRPLCRDEYTRRELVEQAKRILGLNPAVILAATEYGRWAFNEACLEMSFGMDDMTQNLGIPACLVNGTSLIIVEPHPSKSFKHLGQVFARRAEFITSVCNGTEIGPGTHVRFERKTTTITTTRTTSLALGGIIHGMTNLSLHVPEPLYEIGWVSELIFLFLYLCFIYLLTLLCYSYLIFLK